MAFAQLGLIVKNQELFLQIFQTHLAILFSFEIYGNLVTNV